MLKAVKGIGVKAFYRIGINRLAGRSDPRSIILGLHRVIEPAEGVINRRIENLSPSELEGVVTYLRSLDYEFVPLKDIVRDHRRRAAAITFDDGYRDVYDAAFPVLRRLQVPFTIFLTTATLESGELLWQHRLYYALDRLDPKDRAAILGAHETGPSSEDRVLAEWLHRRPPKALVELSRLAAGAAQFTEVEQAEHAKKLYLSRSQIAEMSAEGLSLEAHGHQHWSLPTLDADQTRAEVAACAEIVKQAFGRPPNYYAPAFGKTNPFLRAAVRDCGMEAVIGTVEGLVEPEREVQQRIMTTSVRGLSAQLIKAYTGRWFTRRAMPQRTNS